jgi:UDP-N-acetyl-2-amino-2-deoxyglucuronate dehydrogenase
VFEDINDRKIRLAIVGCGRVSANHFASITKYPDDLELVAVCDTNKQVLDNASSKYGVKGFRSLTEMLSEVELDVVALCTPSGIHSDQTIEVAASGRHVLFSH